MALNKNYTYPIIIESPASFIINSTQNASGIGTGGCLTVLGGASISKDTYIAGNISAGNVSVNTNLNISGNLNTPGFIPPLSNIPNYNCSGAYGLTLLNSSYTGPTIRIRMSSNNSSNNTLSDFTANIHGVLTNTSGTLYSSWIGASSGYIDTWYDQSGSGNHATQSNSSYQPTISIGPNGQYRINFANSNTQFFNIPNDTIPVDVTNAPYTIYAKHGDSENNGGGICGAGTTSNTQANVLRFNVNGYHNYWWANDMSFGTDLNYQSKNDVCVTYNGNTRYGFVNNVLFNTAVSTGNTMTAGGQQYIGKSIVGEYLDGDLYQLYIFKSFLGSGVTVDTTALNYLSGNFTLNNVNTAQDYIIGFDSKNIPTSVISRLHPQITSNPFTVSQLENFTGTYTITASQTGSTQIHYPFRNSSDFWEVGGYSDGNPGVYNGSYTTIVSGVSYGGEWLQIQLPNACVLTEFDLLGRQDQNLFLDRSPRNFIVAGSNNGATWVVVHNQSNAVFSSALQTFTCNSGNNTSYSYFRIIVTAIGNAGNQTGLRGSTLDIARWTLTGKKTLQFNTNSQAPYIQLDSSASQYLDFGSQTFNIATNGGFTAIAYCAFTGSASYYERIFEFNSGNSYGTTNNDLALFRNSTNTYFGANAANSTNVWLTGPNTFNAPSGSIVQNKWNVMCVRYTHSTQLYEIIQDGITIASMTLSSALTNRTFTRTLIGRTNYSPDPYSNLKIGGFYAYDKSLTDNQISIVGNRLRNENSLTVNVGNVGIGNSIPDYALDVRGNVRISGYAYFLNDVMQVYSGVKTVNGNDILASFSYADVNFGKVDYGNYALTFISGKLNPGIAGLYQIDISITTDNTSDLRSLELVKNSDTAIIPGDFWVPLATTNTYERFASYTVTVPLILGDYIWLKSYGGYITSIKSIEVNFSLISI